MSINYTTSDNSKQKLYGIAGALLTLAFPYILMLQNVNNSIDTEQSLCPFKLLTGFPCPGCGMTKSFIYIYEGDFIKSITYHLFGPATFLLCFGVITLLTTELITKKEYFRDLIYNKKVAYYLGTILVLYHFLRVANFVSINTFDEILRQSIWR